MRTDGFRSRLSEVFDPISVAAFQIRHFGRDATDETSRLYVAACAAGSYDMAEYWCEVLRVLYVEQESSTEGTVWELTTPTAVVEALMKVHTREQVEIIIEAATVETTLAGLKANGRFWSAALVWLTRGRPAEPDIGAAEFRCKRLLS